MKKRRRKERGMESHSSPWRRESKVDMFDEDRKREGIGEGGISPRAPTDFRLAAAFELVWVRKSVPSAGKVDIHISEARLMYLSSSPLVMRKCLLNRVELQDKSSPVNCDFLIVPVTFRCEQRIANSSTDTSPRLA